MLKESQIRDINLAAKGQDKLNWVANYMPILNKLKEEFAQSKPFQGQKIVVCLHQEAKTGYLALTLKEGGADVTIVASLSLIHI